MSFFDITGLLGTLVTVRDELEKLRSRYKTFKNDIPQAISSLTSAIAECHVDLQTLHAQLSRAEHIERRISERIEKQLKDVASLCSEAIQTVRDVNQKLNARLYGFFRARKIADTILNPLQTRFAAAIVELKDLNGTFAVINVVEGSREEVIRLINEQSVNKETEEENFTVRFMERSGPDLSREMIDSDSLEFSAKAAVMDARAFNNRLVVLQGGPGTGKTSALCALSRDEDIHHHFVDGVYWISLGMSATVTHFMRHLSRVLASTGARSTSRRIEKAANEIEAVEEACNWFHGKRFLFLIDDVWKGTTFDAGFVPLLHDLALSGDESVLVYTTRQLEMVGNSRHIQFHPRDIFGTHAQRILNSTAGITSSEEVAENYTYRNVLKLCGGILFALAVAGRALSRLRARNLSVVEALEEFARRLDVEKDILSVGIDGYKGLTIQFRTALHILDEDPEHIPRHTSFSELYSALCVLEKQQFAPLVVLQYLWDVSFRSAYHIASDFEGVGIAHLRYEATDEGAVKLPGLRLNDLAHDFVLVQAKDSVSEYHKGLVESYRSLISQGIAAGRPTIPWWDLLKRLNDDGYFSRNIVRHLDEGGMHREVMFLLSDPRWFYGQLDQEGILQIEYEIARVVGKTGLEPGLDSNSQHVLDAKRLKNLAWAARLSLSAMVQNPKEKWFQIHGRLQNHAASDKAIKEYINNIEKYALKPWVRSVRSCLGAPGGEFLSFVSLANRLWHMIQLEEEEYLCGCDSGEVVIVNLRKSRVVRKWKFDERQGSVFRVASSNDHSTLLFGLPEGPIQIVEGHNWTQNRTQLVGHSEFVCSMDVTDDKKFVLSSGYDHTLRLWDLEEGIQIGNVVSAFENGAQGINGGATAHCIAAVPGCHAFIVGGDEHVLRRLDVRFDTPSNEEVNLLPTDPNDTSGISLCSVWRANAGDINCVRYCLNGETFIAGSVGRVLSIWEVSTGNLLRFKRIGGDDVGAFFCIALSSDGTKLAASGSDATVYICDAHSLALIREPIRVHEEVHGVAFMDSHHVVAATKYGVTVLNISKGKVVNNSATGHMDAVFAAELAVNCRFFVTGGGTEDSCLRIWDVETGCQVGEPLKIRSFMGRETFCIRGITEVPNTNRVLVNGWGDYCIRLCEISEKGPEQKATLSGHEDMVRAVSVVPNGDLALSASNDISVRVWDLHKADGTHTVLRGHKTYVGGVSVSPDGKLAISRDPVEVRIWDIQKGSCLRVVPYEDNFRLAPSQLWKELWSEEPSYAEENFDFRLRWIRTSRRITLAADESVMATLDSEILSGAYCQKRHILCVGLSNGGVGIMRLEE